MLGSSDDRFNVCKHFLTTVLAHAQDIQQWVWTVQKLRWLDGIPQYDSLIIKQRYAR